MKLKKNQILGIIAILLALMFVITLDRIVDNEIARFDNFVYDLFVHNEALTVVMKIITFMGEAGSFAIIAILLFVLIKDKKVAFTIPLNLVVIASINYLVKILVRRPRPEGINLIEIGGYSFPSGHSATSLAFYGFIMYLIYKKCENKKIRIISMSLIASLIFMIGISRIYLGVHYASDVIGGFALASVYLIVYILIVQKYIEGGKKNETDKEF